MTRKFEEGKLYVKYAKGYKVIYRITKRTTKKIYFYSIAVETDEPISKFDSTLCTRSKMPGVIYDIGQMFKEESVYISDTHFESYEYENFTVWNDDIGPMDLCCLEEYKEAK